MKVCKVAVLMCTYNGLAHIKEQLESIHEQTINNIDIWISDDGSCDGTVEFLQEYKAIWTKGIFDIRQGPQKGFASNFLSLACDSSIRADYYAYSDQDDIWKRDKLERAINILKLQASDNAQLYCSRTELIDEKGRVLNKYSPLFQKPPGFRNALVQSLAGGNTMLFNQQTKVVLESCLKQNIVSHDWWTYLIVSGCGGTVIYDPTPSIFYRQHADNQIGANNDLKARIIRLGMLFRGQFKKWNEININALISVKHYLSPENREVLLSYDQLRRVSLIKRSRLFYKTGIYRQSRISQLALTFALIIKKI